MIHSRTQLLLAGITTAALPLTTLPATAAQISCGSPYTIVSGDTLSKISIKAYGSSSYALLYNANLAKIGADPNVIYVGQTLAVPCQNAQTAQTNAAPAKPIAADTKQAAAAAETTDSETIATVTSDTHVFTFNKTSGPKFVMNSGIIDLYLAQISEVTEGRVTFVDPEVMNRDPAVQLDLVTSGQVDATYVFNGHLSESHPLLQLPLLPLMGGSAEQTAVSLWRLHEEFFAQTDYFNEAELLGFVAAPASHIWRLTDEPVVPGQDIASLNSYPVPYFEGLDTRGPPAVQKEVAARLDSYNEADNGTLTFFMAHGAARATGIWTPERTVTEVDNGLYTPTFSVIVSNEAWAQISEEDRAAIKEISGEYLAHRSASWDVFDNGHRQHMIDTGLNAVKASPELLKELESALAMEMAPWLQAATANGVPAAEAFNAYKAHLLSLEDRLIYRDALTQ